MTLYSLISFLASLSSSNWKSYDRHQLLLSMVGWHDGPRFDSAFLFTRGSCGAEVADGELQRIVGSLNVETGQ